MRSSSPEGVATAIEEFEQDGVVYEQGGVKVIAFTVEPIGLKSTWDSAHRWVKKRAQVRTEGDCLDGLFSSIGDKGVP